MFKKIHLKEHKINQRAPYTTEFIRDKILNPVNLKQLDDEAKALLLILANIGARPIELVNLIADDIKLNHEVPHIHIKPRKGYSLKTTESERKIPLVGKALEAFLAYPYGFDREHQALLFISFNNANLWGINFIDLNMAGGQVWHTFKLL